MKVYGVIMAGGGGTRFWPVSRRSLPKQFLNLTGKDMMVNETIDRLANIMDKKDIFVVTNISQAPMMAEATKERLQEDHILAEPAARNTSACIGYAALEITRKYGDGIMCVFPSDHFIKQEEEFTRVMMEAVRTAQQTDKLITIGIKPEFPSTGYGYIKHGAMEPEGYCRVEEFVEKPDLETAGEYLRDGSYLWNSGMFVWKASTILKKMERLLPDVYECLMKIGEALNTPNEKKVLGEVYPVIPKISVDYGIMERSDDVLVLPGDFGWNDVGSWDALEAVYEPDRDGNIVCGEFLPLESKDCIIYGKDKLIAAIGIENLIIVEAKQAILVCPKERAQDVKNIVEMLEKSNKIQYL